jgi:hypothetical protein
MSDKLFDWLRKVRDSAVMNGLQSISAGIDIKYEAGRRIGVREGMDVLLNAYTQFHDEKDDKEKDL